MTFRVRHSKLKVLCIDCIYKGVCYTCTDYFEQSCKGLVKQKMKKWQILFNIIMEMAIFAAVTVLLIIFVPKLLGFFWPFVASWLLAMLANPLCNFLEKHIRLNKKWSSAIIIILVLLGLAGLGYVIVTKLGSEIIALLSGAPEYYSYIQNTVRDLGDSLNGMITPVSADAGQHVQEFFDNLLSQLGTAVNKLAPQGVEMIGSLATNLTNGFIGTIVMIIAAYFFIADREQLGERVQKALPEDVAQMLNDIKNRVIAALGGFFVAQIKIMCIIFVILLAGFLLMRNPYALLLALLISIVDLLPILGTGTVLIPWAAICFLQQDYRQGTMILVLYIVCLAGRQFLQPKIIGDSVGMDSMTTLVLIYAGYKLSGIKGMLIAMIVGVIFITLYKLGLFDKKIHRLGRLFYEFRHYDDEYEHEADEKNKNNVK